jgi:hypothetical protein
MRRVMILAALALTGAGCTCGKDDGGTKKAQETASAPGDPRPGLAGKRTAALRNARLAPLTLEEIQPLIPALPGATPVGKPGVMTQGRQVKAVFCMASPSADAAMTQLLAAAGSLGFTDMQTRAHPRNQEMVTVSGEKGPIRLGATAQRGRTPDCPGDQGKIKIVLSYFKRATGEEAPPAPPP